MNVGKITLEIPNSSENLVVHSCADSRLARLFTGIHCEENSEVGERRSEVRMRKMGAATENVPPYIAAQLSHLLSQSRLTLKAINSLFPLSIFTSSDQFITHIAFRVFLFQPG